MDNNLYFCTTEDNTCPKKDECKRYLQASDNRKTTLFKESCTENNGYVLFIKNAEESEEQ